MTTQNVFDIINKIYIYVINNKYYTFNRSWRISGKKITETFFVYKDGVLLENGERSDFENYLLQLLPPNLFKFYFFDGEKISDFIFNGNKDTDFKDAFLKLCNLDTMEIIRDNFVLMIIKRKTICRNKISLSISRKRLKAEYVQQ